LLIIWPKVQTIWSLNQLHEQAGVLQFVKEAKEFQKHQYHLSFGEGRVRPKKSSFENSLQS